MASNIEEKKKLYGMKQFTGLPYGAAGNVAHGNDNIFLDSTSLNNTYGQMVDNDLHLMHSLNRKDQAYDGPTILSSNDMSLVDKLADNEKFMTPATGSSIFSKKKLSLSESFLKTDVPGGGTVEVIAPVASGKTLIGTSSRTFIVDANDIIDRDIGDEDEVFFYGNDGEAKRLSIYCMSQGSFSQSLFGGAADDDNGLFVLKDGQFSKICSIGSEKIVSIDWTYASSILVFASQTRVWTGKFNGSELADVKKVLQTNDTRGLAIDSPLKAFGSITAVHVLEDTQSDAEDKILVFTESGDILQNAVLDNILLDEEWTLVSNDGLEIYDYACLFDNGEKHQYLATSQGLMSYSWTTGKTLPVDPRYTAPVHSLDVHGTSAMWFGDEDGNILCCSSSGSVVLARSMIGFKITDFKQIDQISVTATDNGVLYKLDNSIEDSFTEIDSTLDSLLSAKLETAVDVDSQTTSLYAVGQMTNGNKAVSLARFSNVHSVELGRIGGMNNFDVQINGRRPNYTSIAASFPIDNSPYAVVNCFDSSDKLALLKESNVVDGSLSCAIVKYTYSSQIVEHNQIKADVIDVVPSTLSRGILMLPDNVSFYLVAADNRLIKYALIENRLQKIDEKQIAVASNSIIVDAKPLDNRIFVMTLSSCDQSKKPFYPMQELSIDFDNEDSYMITSFDDINCPSQILSSAGQVHVLSGNCPDFTDARLKSFSTYTTTDQIDLYGNINCFNEICSLNEFYTDRVGMPFQIFSNGEAIVDGGLTIGQLAQRGDLLYNGKNLFAMQSFIGFDGNGEDSPGLFIRSQKSVQINAPDVLNYTLSQVKKNSYAALVGAKAENETSSTFYLAYLRKPEIEHDRSFDSCRAKYPIEMALCNRSSTPQPVTTGSARHTKIESLKQIVDNAQYIEDDISLYSDIAVIESIGDDTIEGDGITSNIINILMYGSQTQKLMRLVIELSSSADPSTCGVTALRLEEVMSKHSISQMTTDENAVYAMSMSESGSDLSAFPIGTAPENIDTALSLIKHFSSGAQMFKSCLSCSDDYANVASGKAAYSSFDSDYESFPDVTDWDVLEPIVKVESKECIKVIESSAMTTVFSQIEDDAIVYDSSDVKNFYFNQLDFVNYILLQNGNNRGQGDRFILNNFIDASDNIFIYGSNECLTLKDSNDKCSIYRVDDGMSLQLDECRDTRLASIPEECNWFTTYNDSLWVGNRNYIDGKCHNLAEECLDKYLTLTYPHALYPDHRSILSIIEVEYVQSDGKSFIDTGIECGGVRDPSNIGYQICINVLSDGISSDYGINSIKKFAPSAYIVDDTHYETLYAEDEKTSLTCTTNFYNALFGVQPYKANDNAQLPLVNNPLIVFADNAKTENLKFTFGHPASSKDKGAKGVEFNKLKFNTFYSFYKPSNRDIATINNLSAQNKYPLSQADKELYDPFNHDAYHSQDCKFWLLNANLRHNLYDWDSGWNAYTWFKNYSKKTGQSRVYSKVNHWHQKLRYAKIYDGDTLLFDGIPVRVMLEGDSAEDSHGCIYDRVSKRLFIAKSFDLENAAGDGLNTAWLSCGQDISYEYDLDYIHLNGQQVIDTEVNLSANLIDYDINLAVSPDGMDLTADNNVYYDSSMYYGLFGGIFNRKSTSDFSLYMDAVNRTSSGYPLTSGVKVGFYNLSTTNVTSLQDQQINWQLSVNFNEFYHYRTFQHSGVSYLSNDVSLTRDGYSTGALYEMIKSNKKPLGAQRFLLGAVGLSSTSSLAGSYGWPIDIKQATICSMGRIVADLVPVIKDGVQCMFDKIRLKFYYPLSSYANGSPMYSMTSSDTLSTFIGDELQLVDDSTNFGATSPHPLSVQVSSTASDIWPHMLRIEKTNAQPQYAENGSQAKDSIAKVYMDYYQYLNNAWSKISSTMINSYVLSTSHGGGPVSYTLGSTAPVQAIQVIDIDDRTYSDYGYLKHPVIQTNVEEFSTFKYDKCKSVDISDLGTTSIGHAELGRIAVSTSDKFEVIVPEQQWNKVKLHSFYEDSSHLTSSVSDINGICSIVYPEDKFDSTESAVVMSYGGQLGLMDISTGNTAFVSKFDNAAAALSTGSIQFAVHDTKRHIIGANGSQLYDFAFSSIGWGEMFQKTGANLDGHGAKHIVQSEQKNTYAVQTCHDVFMYSHDAKPAEALAKTWSALCGELGDMHQLEDGRIVLADGSQILSSNDAFEWDRCFTVGGDEGSVGSLHMIDNDTWAASKSGCSDPSRDGLYTSRYTVAAVNETPPFTELCATTIYEQNEDKVHGIYEDAIAQHIEDFHNAESTVKTVDAFMPVDFGIPDGFTVSSSPDDVHDDYIEKMLTGDSSQGDIVALVKSKVGTSDTWSQTSCWYIAKCWKSGVVDIDIFVGSTFSYYIPHVPGAGYCGAAPSYVTVNGITTTPSINDNTTEMKIQIQSQYFNIDRLLDNTVKGSSLPLMVHKEDNDFDRAASQMWHSFVQPSIAGEFQPDPDENQYYTASYFCFGSDSQSVHATWQDSQKNYLKKSKKIVLNGNGGQTSGGYSVVSLRVLEGTSMEIPESTFTLPGGMFLGWSVDPTSVEPKGMFQPGVEVTYESLDAETIVLHACWTKYEFSDKDTEIEIDSSLADYTIAEIDIDSSDEFAGTMLSSTLIVEHGEMA